MKRPTFSFAKRIDAAGIKRLLSEAGLPSEDIDRHVDHVIVTRLGRRLIACVGLEPYGEIGLLRSLAVTPRHQRRGIGTALCERLAVHADLQGIRDLYLFTMTAADFFARLGFSPIDRDDLPSAIRSTSQHARLCPSSALCMKLRLDQGARYDPAETLRLRPNVPGTLMWGLSGQMDQKEHRA